MKSGNWNIGKDNQLTVNPYELRQLKTRRKLGDRTLNVECPNYQEVDQRSARFVAQMAITTAILGGCSKILVKGKRWRWEFDVRELNGTTGKDKGAWWTKRPGMFINPLELQQSGTEFDTTRDLYQVPEKMEEKSTSEIPADSSQVGSLEKGDT